MNFVEEQLGIIDEYEEKINNYNSTNSNYESIIKEKNEALKQIQTSQNNFKNNFGMLPMTEQFNNKVANIMDLILEQKVKDIKNNNYNTKLLNLIKSSDFIDAFFENQNLKNYLYERIYSLSPYQCLVKKRYSLIISFSDILVVATSVVFSSVSISEKVPVSSEIKVQLPVGADTI